MNFPDANTPALRKEKHMKNLLYIPSPLGRLGVAEQDGALTDLFFANEKTPAGAVEHKSPLLARATAELEEYFEGTRREFTLPLAPAGTPFQKEVWTALLSIPYGETLSYGQVAARIGRPKACRAVGMANNRNPIAIIIPCHRVIGADGSLTGYASGLGIKVSLLELEKSGKPFSS